MYLVLGSIFIFIATCKCNSITGENVTVPERPDIAAKILTNQTIKSATRTTGTVDFTSAEKNALEKFRPLVMNILVRDEDKTDGSLIRWLRARNLDVVKASAMLHAAQKWRNEFKIDTIGNETIFNFPTPGFSISGFDREGHPIVILTPTIFDLRKLAFQGLLDKVYRYVIQSAETALARRTQATRIYGEEINQIVAILDFHGFNLRQHACLSCVPMFRNVFIAMENYYPDVFSHIIAINVPRIALPLIEIMKSLLSQNTLKGVRVFPPDRKEWSNYLSQIIAEDQLPYRFGGTRKE